MWWLIIGLVLGVVIYWLATRHKFTWYEWVLAVLGVILILFAFQNYFASQLEYEPRAGNIMLWMFGLPGLILLVIAGGLAWWQSRKVAPASATAAEA